MLLLILFSDIAIIGIACWLWTNQNNKTEHDEHETSVYFFITVALPMIFSVALIITSITMFSMCNITKQDINDDYRLLQYRVKEYNELNNTKQLHILNNDNLISDIDKWNKDKSAYEKAMNNSFVGFLYPDVYADTDYINVYYEGALVTKSMD